MKHLLSAAHLSFDEIYSILDLAEQMHKIQDREVKKLPVLRGRTIVNAFFEDSTRTRSSFELAEKWLSADSLNISSKGSSVSKGESLKDTMLTLDSMGVDAFVVRHSGSGVVEQTASWVEASVINAGDGWHQHPTQALLDAYAMRQHFRRYGDDSFKGRKVAIVGDLLHSRVVRSNLDLLNTLGAKVVLCSPMTMAPPDIAHWPADFSVEFDDMIEEVDVVMMLRLQRERMSGGFFPSEREYITGWGLTPERLARMKPEAAICHPGPMNRGLEISSEAADSPNALVLNQVSAGVAVRMSVLYHCLGGSLTEQ